jgi:hypothetical protein
MDASSSLTGGYREHPLPLPLLKPSQFVTKKSPDS